MRCPSCSFDNPTEMNFCGKCASPLSPHCPQCGFENPVGFAFCGKCGSPLSSKSKGKRQKAKRKAVQAPGLRTPDPGLPLISPSASGPNRPRWKRAA